MSKEKQKKKLSVGARLTIIICAIGIGVCVGIGISMVGSGSDTGETQAGPDQVAQLSTEPLLDNEFATVTFEKAFTASGIDGVFYLQMKMENKTDREVWVYLDSASVDGAMVTPMSGVPTVIKPGKYSTNPFILPGNLDDANEVSFKMVYTDNETSEEIFRSEEITVNLK